jgi:hypothetical protein
MKARLFWLFLYLTFKNMKNYVYLLATFLLFSCNSKSKISGDLYFKLVDITASSGRSKEQIEKLKYNLHNYKSKDELSKSDLELIGYFTLLEKNNLLELPYIYLKSSDKTNKIFLSKKEYEKVKSFRLSDLNGKGKKVKMELEYELKDSLYYSDKILKVQEVDGETPWQK